MTKPNYLHSIMKSNVFSNNRFSSITDNVIKNKQGSCPTKVSAITQQDRYKAINKILLLVLCCIINAGVPVFGQTVTKQLYLSDPGQSLDRVDPVTTLDSTTSQTASLSPTSQYLYGFRGASKTDFWRYDVSTNTWTVMAAAPATITSGASLASDGKFIYALRGGGTADFWRYNPATNTWSTLASPFQTVSAGSAVTFLNGVLYVFKGGSTTTFMKYTIATNIWALLLPTPTTSTVDWGGALANDGNDVYALRGNSNSTFWKYSILTDTWTALGTLPAVIDGGGSLSFNGLTFLALRGGGNKDAYKYDMGTNTWSSIALAPNSFFKGAALVCDDVNTYALRGNNSNNFWRFNGTTWATMANTPSSVDSGGAIVKFGTLPQATVFTQTPTLCSQLKISAGTINVSTYLSIQYGTMPVNPNITAVLKYSAINIITLTNPTYNASNGLLSWTGLLASGATIPAGLAVTLTITTNQPNVSFKILFDSKTKPSKIDLPVTTFINVNSVKFYDGPYPGGNIITTVQPGNTCYIRSVVSDPFGFSDITGLDVSINPIGASLTAVSVNGSGCSRVFEAPWTVPAGAATYTITATAKEGTENTVTHSKSSIVGTCVQCPPNVIDDAATVNGGESILINVLANDSDPNNNMDPASLTVTVDPRNGQVILDNKKLTYVPNGSFAGIDTFYYQVCDLTAPIPLCGSARVIVTVLPVTFNTCTDATKDRLYYMPFSENEAQIALQKSANIALPSKNIRTIISIKITYPGMKLVWDHWEDGYETNILNPTQSSTQVWGDGNIYNGIAPGYPTDIIPAGGSIVMDNTMLTPRVASNIFYDGKDKLYSSGQVAVTQVCGEPKAMPVQCLKTNVSAYPTEYGKSFVIPVGTDIPSQDFKYMSLFIRASQDNTTIQIDRDHNGTFGITAVLNEGQVLLVDDATAPAGNTIKAGAVVLSDKPIAIDFHSGGVDQYSCREAPIFPASWYSNTYYTPTPTTNSSTGIKDTAAVMFYNSLSRDINIVWTSGLPATGAILVKANSYARFPMPVSATAAYKFVNPTGESFVAIEIVDSYTPGGGGNNGTTYDWSFNLLSEERLTDFATVAWAPGGLDLDATPGPDVNGNPIWVTPTTNTTLYVKYDGDITTGPSTSPCGLKYDVAIPLNALNYTRIRDPYDNDQSGIAVYTCNGAKIAAVYGEDPQGSLTGIGVAYWDVGTTIQPFCKEKLVFANNDFTVTLVGTPVNIPVIKNDAAFFAIVDPASVSTTGLLPPKNGSIIINPNGSITYTPNPGFIGNDTFQYSVCSTPFPVVCGTAFVYITIGSCPTPLGNNIISGQVYLDRNMDGHNNDGGTGFSPAKVYLYNDGNCNGNVDPNELLDSAVVDATGRYQFVRLPEKSVADNFDLLPSGNSCKSGTDGNTPWKSDWTDVGDISSGFCVSPAQTADNTDVEIVQDGSFGFALRIDDANKSAIRQLNVQNATKAFLDFSYRRSTTALTAGEDVLLQLSKDGTTYNTIYTIAGNGVADAAYINISNVSINIGTYSVNNKTYFRILTNGNVDEGDDVFIDNIVFKFLQYDQCYIITVDSAAFPLNSFLTNNVKQKVTFTSAGMCVQPIDFGVKRILTYTVNDENSTWQGMAVSGTVAINDFDQEADLQIFGSFLHPITKADINSGAVIPGVNKTGGAVANAGILTFTNSGNYTFAPASGFTGVVKIPYLLCDNGHDQACTTSWLAITVDPLPNTGNSIIANNDEDISYGKPISGNLLNNDRDPKYLSFSLISFMYDTNSDAIPDVTSTPGTVAVSGINIYNNPVANAGDLTIAADGSYTFTPTTGFVGGIDASYTITNTAGITTMANIHIDVLADINGNENDPPFAGDDFSFTTVNQNVKGSFINNDREPNGEPVSYLGTTINTSGPATQIGAAITTQAGGQIKFYADGSYLYIPKLGYIGPDLVTYSICDVTTINPKPLCASGITHFLVGPGFNISGKVWDDANGDVIKNGVAEPATNLGGQLFINLVDDNGLVVLVAQVLNDGTYLFVNAPPGRNYSLELSTKQGVPGTPSPGVTLPQDWVNTGETRNGIIDYGAKGIIDSRPYGFINVSNFDFGIEQLPNSTDLYANISTPTIGQFITLNGGSNPPSLSGKDLEDCPAGCSLSAQAVIIDSMPLNANLYYNGVLVNSGLSISNFNPSLLKVEITTATLGSSYTMFSYSYVDAAGQKDPTPAIYSLNWLVILPAKGLTLTANRIGNDVALNWQTLSEINSVYFQVERSMDGRNYTKVGGKLSAAGTSDNERKYESGDDISDVKTGSVVYYRIKLVDKTGKYAYSNVAIVKLPGMGSIKVSPNPFVSDININMAVEQNTSLAIRIMDITGRVVLSTTQKISKEAPQVAIKNLNYLKKGIYVVEVIDMQSDKRAVVKIEKN